MIAPIREQVRLSITRQRDAGSAAIQLSSLRRDIVGAADGMNDLSEDVISRIIVEECANVGMPVVLQPYDNSEKK